MTLLTNVQRIIIEDFQEEDRATVEKLANVLNYYMTQNTDIINGRLGFENMNRRVVTIDVTVDANGTPIQTTNFSSEQGLIGGNVISAQNLTNSAVYVDSCPFISFTPIQANLYKVNNIKGLPANNRFRLTYEVLFNN